MPVVTLLSDWGTTDHYLAAVKGTLLKHLEDAKIVDITHDITPFNIHQASFVLKNSYQHFPEGTIHIIGVNSDASIETPHIVVAHQGQYFICADNGIMSLVFEDGPEKIFEVDIIQDSDYFTFSTRDLFLKVAIHVASGKSLNEIGFEKKELNKKMSFQPVLDKSLIIAKVIYVDNYGNSIVNISEELFREAGKGRPYVISFKSVSYEITTISTSYKDVPEGEMLALFGAHSFLEIAINQGSASQLLGLGIDDAVRVEFQ